MWFVAKVVFRIMNHWMVPLSAWLSVVLLLALEWAFPVLMLPTIFLLMFEGCADAASFQLLQHVHPFLWGRSPEYVTSRQVVRRPRMFSQHSRGGSVPLHLSLVVVFPVTDRAWINCLLFGFGERLDIGRRYFFRICH